MLRSVHRSAGLTLTELMVAVTVGLILLAGLTSAFVAMLHSNAENLNTVRLNQDLRTIMHLIVSDLRRAGYSGNAFDDMAIGTGTAPNNDFMDSTHDMTISQYGTEAANSCITYSYDADDNAVADASDDLFGWRLNDGAVQRRQDALLCNEAGWQNITDEAAVQVTDLTFTETRPDLPTGTAVAVRDIEITLTGHLKGDSEVDRTLIETVRLRNDLILDTSP